MSTLGAYRRLVGVVGVGYLLIAFVGRVPLAMSQMGVLVMISESTGRYGLGGAAAGALALANAFGAPVFGSWADRFGQRPVVLAQSLGGGLGLVTIAWFGQSASPAWLVVLMSAVTGLLIPQIGPLARVRWAPVLADEDDQRALVDVAFSYEGAVDEISFVLGPAAVGVLAVLANPVDAVVSAGLVLAVFGSWFALHPTARWEAPAETGTDAGRLLGLTLVLLAVAQLLLGVLFGATQTGTTALVTEQGRPEIAGLVHAVTGIGSAIAGVAVAAVPARFSYESRMAVAGCSLLALSVPLLFTDSIGSLLVVIAVLGFAIAPFMIGNFAMAGRVVATSRVGTAMTLLAATTGVGYAIGSSAAGSLADWGGHRPAFAVTVVAMACAAVLSLGVAWRARRRTAQV